MNFFDIKGLIQKLLIFWIVLVAIWITLEILVAFLLRYWFVVAFIAVLAAGIWAIIRWNRGRVDRW